MRGNARFGLGEIVATVDVLDLYGPYGIDLGLLFDRHTTGDWGYVSEDRQRENDRALMEGGPLVSMYDLQTYRIRIVTGPDHRYTTVSMLDTE